MAEYNIKNEKIRDAELKEAHSIWQHPWHLVHRVRLHEELKKRATSLDGPGKPAVLKTCSRVSDVDQVQGIVYLENGETYKGDVVIGADGVHVSRLAQIAHDGRSFPHP
jgi:2-polyprenyl-6-methoxyphenol hydroxylase-like FAD-dependent oxidoreductase